MITTYEVEELETAVDYENNSFGIIVPAENCAIFGRGWQPEEIEEITVIFRKYDAITMSPIESNKFIAVTIDDELQARIVYYRNNEYGEVIITDPVSYVYPYDRGDSPIVMSVAEAAKRLNILGVAEKYYVTLKGAKK